MKRTTAAILIFLIAAAVVGAAIFLFFFSKTGERVAPGTIVSEPAADFSRIGNLSKGSDGGWKLVYEEPGSPALIAALVFSEKSSCAGVGSGTCDTSLFSPGERVAAEGVKTAGGEVLVTRLLPAD